MISRGYPWPMTVWLVVCTAAGLALRLLGARGELWQDEVWTFALLRTVNSPLGIFLDMSADNNHFLNTLYLYYVGPDAAPIAQRALSILLGVATIPAVAVALRSLPRPAQLFGIAVFALGYPMVHYGSEARGYAGFILFTVISFVLVERELDAPLPRNRLWLGISNLLGTLFQPIMLGTIAVLIGWTLWTQWRRDGSIRRAAAVTQTVFSVTVRLLLIVLILAVLAVYRVGGYRILNTDAFTPGAIIEGYGGMLRYLLGLGESGPEWLVLVVVMVAATAAIYLARHHLGRRASFYALAMLALPAAMFCARLPNLVIYRYYLLSSCALLLLLSELFALAWQRGGWMRAFALLLAGGLAAGNAVELAKLFTYHRGSYEPAIRTIAASATPSVSSNLDGIASTMIEFHQDRHNLRVDYVHSDSLCKSDAAWLIQIDNLRSQKPETLTFGAPGCSKIYRKHAYYPAWGLSGWEWTLYRRAAGESD